MSVVATTLGVSTPAVEENTAGGGQLGAGWLGCTYGWGPANVGIEYRTGQSASTFASLFAIVNGSMGAVMASGIGDGAIEVNGAGHDVGTVAGQAPNVPIYVLIGTVIFYIEGQPTVPLAKEIALAKAMIPFIESGKTSTPFTGPIGNLPPKVGSASAPKIVISSTGVVFSNGFVMLALRCSGGKCSGVAELYERVTVKANGGSKIAKVVLATARYMMPKSSSRSLKLVVTATGTSDLGNVSVNPLRVKAQVTVSNGATVTKTVVVS